MISAISLAQRQTIQPKIQRQQSLKQRQVNAANVNFRGESNVPAMALMGVISAGAIIGGGAELFNIFSNAQSIKIVDGMHIFESFMGILLGGGAGFASYKAYINEGPIIKFASDEFKKLKL